MKKIISELVVFCLLGFVLAGCGTDGDSGAGHDGSGTQANPYLIYTKADFMAISVGQSSSGKYYRLEADLIGDNSITEPLGKNYDSISFSGNNIYAFAGNFDGNGRTINLDIKGNYHCAGLFACLG